MANNGSNNSGGQGGNSIGAAGGFGRSGLGSHAPGCNGGSGCKTSITALSYNVMEDSKDTVIVTGIGNDIKMEDFVNHFKHIGIIIKSNMRTEAAQGIVTFADPEMAKQATETLNNSILKGSVINVQMADKFFICHTGRRGQNSEDEVNTAWQLWLRGNGNEFHYGRNIKHGGGGGGGGKGGKGGSGGPNVPSGHDGKDGEPGPGGKGGAGGRPAITNSSLGKRPNDWNQNGSDESWHSRGTRGRRKEVDNNLRSGEDNDYITTGGGKGGRGGKAYGMKSGRDGEDGEAGPGGKGGRGGKPAL